MFGKQYGTFAQFIVIALQLFRYRYFFFLVEMKPRISVKKIQKLSSNINITKYNYKGSNKVKSNIATTIFDILMVPKTILRYGCSNIIFANYMQFADLVNLNYNN